MAVVARLQSRLESRLALQRQVPSPLSSLKAGAEKSRLGEEMPGDLGLLLLVLLPALTANGEGGGGGGEGQPRSPRQ